MAQNSDGSAKRKKTGGRDFPPGQSGNPGGRPKMPEAYRLKFDEMTPQALQNLQDGLTSQDWAVKRWATEQVLDRNLGRPAQAVNVTSRSEVDDMDLDQVQEWLRARGIPADIVHPN